MSYRGLYGITTPHFIHDHLLFGLHIHVIDCRIGILIFDLILWLLVIHYHLQCRISKKSLKLKRAT
jgi:hypothetical protein